MASLSRAQKIRLGLFVGTGLALLGASFVVLVARALLEHRDFYFIDFVDPNISFSGLDPGADVKYSGIRIGRVEQIRVKQGNMAIIEVSISIEHNTPIAEDSSASIGSQGITGIKHIELSRGSATAQMRAPGSTIPAGPSRIDELTARATTIAEKLEVLVQNLNTMTGPSIQMRFEEVLSTTSDLLAENRRPIHEIVQELQQVASHFRELSSHGIEVTEKTSELVDQLQRVGKQLETSLGPEGPLLTTLGRSDQVLTRIELLLLRSESDLDVTLRNLNETSANLSDFSLELRENPTMLFGNTRTSSNGAER